MIQRQQLVSSRKIKISCVAPFHNEADILEKFIITLESQLKQLTDNYEIILVDDGSEDDSLTLVETIATSNKQIKILGLARNFGKENALSAGLQHSTGDVTVLIDADLQHPVELITEFVKGWADGYDMVYGIRDSRKNESWLKRNCAKSFYHLVSKISKIDIPTNAGDYRLLDKKVVAALNSIKERNKFMKGLYSWVGFKNKGIMFVVKPRAAGKSTMHLKHLTELALTGITAFSDVPLRIWGLIGIIIAAIAFIYGSFIVVKTLLFGIHTPGFATLVVAVMFLGGIQLISIGILGEYISRIFNEVKKRPNYIIANKINFDA